MFVHLGVAVTQTLCLGFGSSTNDLFAVVILMIGMNRHDFCNVFIYMVLCLIRLFAIFFRYMYALQLHGLSFLSPTQGLATSQVFVVVFDCFLCVFYTVAIFISYRAYREFKGMFEDKHSEAKVMNPFSYSSVKV
jgi:hypothetical protein